MLVVILIINLDLVSCTLDFTDSVTIENGNFKYEIAGNGRNLHFIDKVTGEDYLDSEAPSNCAYIIVDGEKHEITALTREREYLTMEFGKSGVLANIHIRNTKDHITLKVASVTGDIESFVFLNVPLKLERTAI